MKKKTRIINSQKKKIYTTYKVNQTKKPGKFSIVQ